MRASRLLSILILLQMRGRLSAEALAAEFEVSVRTIYRDIDQLSAAGVPVYAERGRSGGFALHEGYRTKLTGFTSAEAEALLLAGIGDAAAALGVGAQANAAQLKLLASLPEAVSASAQQINARFHVDPTAWYAEPETIGHLPELANAVWRDRRVRLEYDSWKGLVTREADTLGLVLKNGVWYLVASHRRQPRTYRASSIRGLTVLDATAQRPPRFDLARYWKAWAQNFEARLFSAHARVRLSPQAMRDLRATHPRAAAVALETGRRCKNTDWIEAEIPIEEGVQGVRQLLRLGDDMEVVGPAALRKAVAAQARAVATRHAHGR